MKRSSVISLRIDNDILDTIEAKAKESEMSESKTIRNYIKLGILTESFKHEIKNPDFLKSIDALKEGDALIEWSQTLTKDQRSAIRFALDEQDQLEYKQTRFNSEIRI